MRTTVAAELKGGGGVVGGKNAYIFFSLGARA